MPLYMLETDTVSDLLRGKTPSLDAKISAIPADQIWIAAVARAALLHGLKLKESVHRLAMLIERLLGRVECFAWDEAAATHFAELIKGAMAFANTSPLNQASSQARREASFRHAPHPELP